MQVVVASYLSFTEFVVPEGIDINDKDQVKSYEVKWDTLTITLVDGTEIKIENAEEVQGDRKRPFKVDVEEQEQ